MTDLRPAETAEPADDAQPAMSRPAAVRDAWSRWADRAWTLVRRIHLASRRPSNWIQLFKFGVVGASGYVVNLVVFAALVELAGTGHITAAVGAFLVAVTNNFLWNRQWTFRADAAGGHPAHQGARFLIVSLIAFVVNLVVLELLVTAAGLGEIASQAIAVAVSMPVNFAGNKLWTFTQR